MSHNKSTWNLIAPLIAGVLVIAIVFAWIYKDVKGKEAIKRDQENALRKKEGEIKAREELQKQKDQIKKLREAEIRRQAAAAMMNQKWNWVRQKETTVSQSGVRDGMNAAKAADGIKDGSMEKGGVAYILPALNRTKKGKDPAWWKADLGKDRPISEVVIYNCTDGDLGKRLSNFNVTIVNEAKEVVFDEKFCVEPGAFADKEVKIDLPSDVSGRYFRLRLLGPNAKGDGALNIAEIEILGRNPDAVAE